LKELGDKELSELFRSGGLRAVYYSGMEYGARKVAGVAQFTHPNSIARNLLPIGLAQVLKGIDHALDDGVSL
jgi:hypothetical protein